MIECKELHEVILEIFRRTIDNTRITVVDTCLLSTATSKSLLDRILQASITELSMKINIHEYCGA